MSRISSHSERRIVELWFQGLPRDLIAQRLCVSGSTVSKIVNLLPEFLQELRSLSIELRKLGLSPAEARSGANFISKLGQLGMKPRELEGYIEASKKISKKAGYEPQQIVEAAVTLSNLEAKAGKSYFEVLRQFEITIRHNRSLKEENRRLEVEQKKKLVQNRVTENEIKYIINLRQDFRVYGIDLADAETLQRYLQNMQETNGDPTKFVEYTKKHGSLEKNVKAKAEVLQTLTHKIEYCRTEASGCLAELSSLKKETHVTKQNLETLQRQEQEAQERIQQKLALLSDLLEVETEGKTIKEALDSKRLEVKTLEAKVEEEKQSLQITEKQNQEFEDRNQILENEIKERLQIKNYMHETQPALDMLEHRKALLQKENQQNEEKLALADTITNFLTRQAPYDFNIFYAYVQNIGYIRERGFPSWPGALPILEEKVRMLALKAFEGDLVSTMDYQEVQSQKNDLEIKVAEKDKEIEETNRQLECATNKNKILEAIKLNFEGRSVTLVELQDWVAQIFYDQIEKRASEKCNILAAGTSGILDFVFNKIKNKETPQ
jgi:hypothetical protein